MASYIYHSLKFLGACGDLVHVLHVEIFGACGGLHVLPLKVFRGPPQSMCITPSNFSAPAASYMYCLLKFFGACSELHHPYCLLLTPLSSILPKARGDRQNLKILQCLCSQTYDLYQQPNFAPAAGYCNTPRIFRRLPRATIVPLKF